VGTAKNNLDWNIILETLSVAGFDPYKRFFGRSEANTSSGHFNLFFPYFTIPFELPIAGLLD